MKILFIAGWYPDKNFFVEGVFVQEHAQATALFNEIVVIYGRESKTQKEPYRFSEQKENGFPVIRFTYRRPFFRSSSSCYVNGVLIAFKKLREQGFIPQIVHANVFHTARPAVIIKRIYGTPFVLTEHKSRFLFPSFLGGKFKRVRWIPEATTIMPVSQTLLKGMKSHGIKGNFSVVPNAIDTNIFYPAINKNCNKNTKKIITVARITPAKGIGDLLKALKEVKKKRDDFSLDIIGTGKSRKDYEKMAAELNLSTQVSFLGHRDKREIAEMMRRSDFFILPTYGETFGCVFAEAMTCGLPIVGTTVGAVPEFFGNPEFGILVPPGDINRLVQTIDYMLDNYQKYDSVKIAKYSQENFSHSAVGKKFSEIYQQAVVPTTHSMKKKKPIIIDFVGKSGAGKTYVKNQLLKHMIADHACLDISDAKITAKDCFTFFLTAPKTCLASLALIFFNIPNSYYSILKLLKKWFAVQIKIQKASLLNYDFVLNDEGLFIRIGWIRNRTLRKVTFDRIPDSIKKRFFYPDLTLFVTANFNLSEQRRLQRIFANKKNLRPTRSKKIWYLNFLKHLQQDLFAAEKAGLIKKVLYYNNDGNFDVSLIDQINELFQGN